MAKATSADTTADNKVVKTAKPGKPAAAAAPSWISRVSAYFRDVRAEMTRVVWPTRSEVLNSSVVVVTTLIFFILFITIVDYVLVVPLISLIAKIKIGG